MPKKSFRSSDTGYTVDTFIAAHRGELGRLGCKDGSGFIYAGKLGGYTVDAIRYTYGANISDFPVIDYYGSYYGGWIIIIPGRFNGNAEAPKELEKEPNGDAPIEHYIRFADAIAGRAAENYKLALIGVIVGAEKSRAGYERDIADYENFFRSETFDLICPHCDGEEVLSLIQKEARKELNKIEERREEKRKKRDSERPYWHWVH